ncbi:MAG: hypothetical protein HQM09_23785 [Candidatus Riflebacteria bacterium]|nr:hypothetical protein [Candidatus Riflebacteria bacterium]
MPQKKKPKSSPLTRSEVMSRLLSKNTGPELRVRKVLWAGIRSRLYGPDFPGLPDLYFPGSYITSSSLVVSDIVIQIAYELDYPNRGKSFGPPNLIRM